MSVDATGSDPQQLRNVTLSVGLLVTPPGRLVGPGVYTLQPDYLTRFVLGNSPVGGECVCACCGERGGVGHSRLWGA